MLSFIQVISCQDFIVNHQPNKNQVPMWNSDFPNLSEIGAETPPFNLVIKGFSRINPRSFKTPNRFIDTINRFKVKKDFQEIIPFLQKGKINASPKGQFKDLTIPNLCNSLVLFFEGKQCSFVAGKDETSPRIGFSKRYHQPTHHAKSKCFYHIPFK